MQTFNKLLANTLIASVTTSFLWFALTFWAYVETRSVIVASVIGGAFMLFTAFGAMFFGHVVDHHRKKYAFLLSSGVALLAFVLAGLMYLILPQNELLDLGAPYFYLFTAVILGGAVAGNLRGIALSTTVTMLVPEDRRDKANGLVGTINGISFTVTSVFSGLSIGLLGMGWTIALSIIFMFIATAHMLTIRIPEAKSQLAKDHPDRKLDVRGTIKTIHKIPGLMALIFFATFNNFLGGVFMALMDPYGLELVSVETWGIVLALTSVGFIVGGALVAKYGLGPKPIKTLFVGNIALWVIGLFFASYASIILMGFGMFLYMMLIPMVEASEQTVLQKVVPYKRQGRVFGFAQSLESAASPVTSFAIGPITQLVFIPFMSAGGAGAATIGGWFGTGTGRGIALVFIVAALIGLIVTLIAMRSRSYHLISDHYENHQTETSAQPDPKHSIA